MWVKLVGTTAIVFFLAAFIAKTVHKYYIYTGTTQFSAFGGWQLASNALFAYANTAPSVSTSAPTKFKSLHAIVNRHIDSLRHLQNRPDKVLGVYYLWDEQSPLKKYLRYKYQKDSATDGFIRWSSVAPLYAGYGAYLIKQYPIEYLKYYVSENMINYYVPSTEFMGIYNMGKDTIAPIAQSWFGYKTNRIHSFNRSKEIRILEIYPILLAIINLLFILCLVGFIALSGFRKCTVYFSRTIYWAIAIWLTNFIFSVLASPIVLRYQVSSMITTFTFMILLLSFIIEESQSAPQGDSKANIRANREQ